MAPTVQRGLPEHAATLSPLWERARAEVARHRGGADLLATLAGGRSWDGSLERLLGGGELWMVGDPRDPSGFAWVSGELICALYVVPERRRQGLARELVRVILAAPRPPHDGYALPGDRATKSLFESIGWKARLLTMRAG